MFIFEYLIFIILGSAIGSFIGATVWRIRAKDLVLTKADSSELEKISFLNKSKLTKIDQGALAANTNWLGMI